MGLETGTTVSELNASWPLGTDGKSQGDDHLRLIKAVLKNLIADDAGPNTYRQMLIGGVGMFHFSAGGIRQLGGQSNGLATRLYVANNTWTKPAQLQFVFLMTQGAGGAGGGTAITAAGQSSAGAGGGAGGFGWTLIRAEDLPATVSVTIGSAGAVNSGGPGGAGGTTSFGSFMTVQGGSGGNNGPVNASLTGAIGGQGGLVVSGSLLNNGRGQAGHWSLSSGGVAFGGDGGNSLFGMGGQGGIGSANGSPAVGVGAGGGGATAAASVGATRQGGQGAGGMVFLVEVY